MRIPKLLNNKWFCVALVLCAGIIAYHNCLPNAMFWDDDDFILKNRYIKDWKYFPNFFSENLVAGGYLLSNYWRPLLLTVFAAAWHLWQTWGPGWHALNMITHSLDAVLLFFLLERLFANRILSLAAALLFVTHPVHNEAVVYVNSLGDSLAAFFVLGGLLLFARFRQSLKPAYASRNYYFAAAAFPCAVASKETGFVLCALLPMMDVLALQSNASLPARIRNAAAAAWPLAVMALIYVHLRGTVLNFNDTFNFYHAHNAFTDSIAIRLLTFCKACFLYAGFLFFPYQLRVERQMPFAHSLLEPDVLAGVCYLAAMVFGIFHYWRRKPLLAFGFCWFLIAIVPASNIFVPINAVLYEHFLYLPMIGIVVAFLGVILPLIAKWRAQPAAAAVFMVVIALFCGINIRRNLDWRTAIGFYEQLVRYAPSYRVINNLGMEYANKGFQQKALIWYQKAIAMDPKNPVAYHNIAGTYRDLGRLDLAEANFKKAVQLDPNFIFAYRSLADLYWRLKNYGEARKYIEVLVRFDPQDQNARGALDEVNALIAKQSGLTVAGP